MNLKKKLADTKAKLKKFAPHIALVTAVAGTVYAVYSATKNAPEVITIQSNSNPSGDDDVVVWITADELKRLAENDSYEVTHIDRDLFQLKETTNN